MSTLFQPVGEIARWKTLYDLLAATEVTGVVTYDDMGKALDLDPVSDRTVIQQSLRRAAAELGRIDHRSVEAVRNVGYRIVRPDEHLRLAEGHHRRAGRQLKAGLRQVVEVDLTGMDAETRKAFEVVGHAFSVQMDLNRRMELRQRNLEEAIGQAVQKSEATDDQVRRLAERIAALEGHAPR